MIPYLLNCLFNPSFKSSCFFTTDIKFCIMWGLDLNKLYFVNGEDPDYGLCAKFRNPDYAIALTFKLPATRFALPATRFALPATRFAWGKINGKIVGLSQNFIGLKPIGFVLICSLT